MLLAIITYFILVFPVFFSYYIIINILYMLYFLNTIKSAIWTSILLSLITFYCPFSLLNLTLLLFYFLKLFFLNSFNFSSVSNKFNHFFCINSSCNELSNCHLIFFCQKLIKFLLICHLPFHIYTIWRFIHFIYFILFICGFRKFGA